MDRETAISIQSVLDTEVNRMGVPGFQAAIRTAEGQTWYGVSGTRDTNQQLAYFISGGLLGTGVLGSGIALLISYEHVADRATLERVVQRLDRLEYGLAAEFDDLRAETSSMRDAVRPVAPSARRAR